jgi:hypothetical protein
MIPTASQLHNQARKLDRKISNVARVLAVMRSGQTLRLHYTTTKQRWFLSNGREVTEQTALRAIANIHVVPVGDTLFADTFSQTYRYTF